MNKTELINSVAKSAEITKKDATAAVEAVFESISQALAGGDKITIVGFGTFEVRDRAERTGVNPSNPNEKIVIPATRVPAFKAGKNLKERVAKS